MAQDDEWLSFKAAMAHLKLSRSTLYRLMWSGHLQGYKVGSTWRFKRSDLDACAISTQAPALALHAAVAYT